jgi:Tol biopolymer transport system component
MSPNSCWVLVLLALLAACGDDKGTTPTADTTPPAEVQDLAVRDSLGGRVTLSWTAPGDDGMEGQATRYDIRCSKGPLSESEWNSALVVDSSRAPLAAGYPESLIVSGLAEGLWHFGLKTVDEAANWSSLSNVVSATVIDTIPPARVTDLAAVFATTTSIELTWTAPGDDSNDGRASEYDLRYAVAPITDETWDDAQRVESVPTPAPTGSPESYTIGDLELGTTYSFALKVVDDALNVSELSNVVSRSTANVVRLTFSSNPFGAHSPAWSPDGQSIAFVSYTEGDEYYRANLFMVPAAGGEPVQLTDEPEMGGAYSPSWSPDGTQIAFWSTRTMYHEIYIMDAVPGADPVQVTTFQGERAINEVAWSRDGSRFAYVNAHFQDPLNEVYVIPSTGGTSTLVAGEMRFTGLNWSPDGSRIALSAYLGTYPTGTWDIRAIPVGGGSAVRLTNGPGNNWSPAWSPDGSRIAFASDRAGVEDLWLMSSTGEHPIQLTHDQNASSPSWSPDATRIAFVSYQNERGDIWVLELE